MAKKQSVYSKNRERILSTVRRYNKWNKPIDLYLPTESELKAEGIKGSKLTRYTQALKKITTKDIRELYPDDSVFSKKEFAKAVAEGRDPYVEDEEPWGIEPKRDYYELLCKAAVEWLDDANFGKLSKIFNSIKNLLLKSIEEYGYEVVGKALEKVPVELMEELFSLYASDQVESEYTTRFINALSFVSDSDKNNFEEIVQ